MTKYGVNYRLERLNGKIKAFIQQPNGMGGFETESECDPKLLPHPLWMQYDTLRAGGMPVMA